MKHYTILALLFCYSLCEFLTAPLMAQETHRLGWKSNPHHAKGLLQIATNPKFAKAALPPAASVRGAMPVAYDQGQIGSCTANAGCGAFEYQWNRQHGQFAGLSRLDLYQNELKHDGNYPNDSGSYTATILWVLKNQGVCLEKCWPYNTAKLAKSPPACAAQSRKNYMGVKLYDVPNDDNGYSIRQCIANIKIPVMTGGYVYQGIFHPIKDAKTGRWYVLPPKKGEKPVGGHEIVIDEFDDELVIAGIKGWADIQNSWSPQYGDNGHALLPQSYLFNPHQFEDNGAIEVTK